MNTLSRRVSFISIQNGHSIACNGYKQSSVRTGYESVLAQRTSDLFAYAARQDGVVTTRTATSVIVTYADGTKKAVELGRRFGSAAGLTIPHDVISDMKSGTVFKKGDIISYNKNHFEKDWLNPNNVVLRSGILVKTVLYESNQTLEDASSISKRLAKQLSTNTTKIKYVIVNFDNEVRNIVKAKDVVEPETILCMIEEATTSGANLFNEESLNTLRLLSSQTPTAKTKGTVDKVEVFYHGEIEDMSNSLAALASQSDSEIGRKYRSLGKLDFSGRVTDDYRVDGEPLLLNTAAIKIYITGEVPSGIGDKGVFANQMKTVFSEVLEHDMITESGETIDAVFGALSISNRIVNSPFIIGTTNTLLKIIGSRAVKIFKEGT